MLCSEVPLRWPFRLFPSARTRSGAVLLLALLSSPAFGAAPANDLCANADLIPGNGPFPHLTPLRDLTEATQTGDPRLPICQTNVARSVWYRFTPSQTGLYALSTCDAITATTEGDTVLGIYNGNAGCSDLGSFPLVDCSDDSCGLQAALMTPLNAGVRYFIVIWQYDDDSVLPGQVQLRVEYLRPPQNDTCATAVPLSLNIPVKGSTVLAQNQSQLSSNSCLSGSLPSTALGGDVVYSFVAPVPGDYSFRVSDYESGNLVLYLASACSSGSPVIISNCLAAANRSTASTAEELVCVNLAAAQKVYLFVDEDELSSGSAFKVFVTACTLETEPNDSPETAQRPFCRVAGTINSSTDRDFFALGQTGSGERVFALVEGEGANLTDFELRITTTTDVLEYDDQDNDRAFGNRSPNVAGTPLPGGPTFALVTYSAPPNFNGAGPYHFYSVVQPPLEFAALEVEPNGTMAEATRAVRNYFYGSLALPDPDEDFDYYAVEAKAGDELFVSLDGDPLRDLTPIDAKLSLFHANGTLLAGVDESNSSSVTNQTTNLFEAFSPRSPGEALVFHAPTNGTYYVQVTIGDSVISETDGRGDYLLSIAINCAIGKNGQQEAAKFLSVTRVGDQSILLLLEGSPGASYRLISSANLVDWTTLGIGTADETGRFQVTDTPEAPPVSVFYRAVWP